MASSFPKQFPPARRLARWFITKPSLVINQTNLLFVFFFLCSTLFTSLLTHYTVVATLRNPTCYLWDFYIFHRFEFFDKIPKSDLLFLVFNIFYRFNFFLIKSDLTFPGLWQPLNLSTPIFWFWLWLFGCDFFGNTLCHTRKQTHHRLSQHRLKI